LVEGKITVYLPMIRLRSLSKEDVYEQTSSTIQNGMNSGVFVQSTSGIAKLSYLNDGRDTGTGRSTLPPLYASNNTSVTVSSGVGKNNSSSPIAWALIGVFGGLFALAVLAFVNYRNRQKRKDRDEEPKCNVVSLDDNTVASFTSPIAGRRGMAPSDASSVNDRKTGGGRYW
jgi:hypothetical protein